MLNENIQKQLSHLYEIKNRFQPFIKNPKTIYTFVAPSDKYEYDKFIEIAAQNLGFSISSTLRNQQSVNNILNKYLACLVFP